MEQRKSIVRYDDFYGMLSDDIRMSAFKAAINNVVQQGDVVLDMGAGTGILSFWALQAGAKKVYAIEKSDAIELARAVAHHNGMADRIVFIQGNSKEIDLPEKVDVLISETLGCFGVDENMMDFIIDARERFLKPHGRMIPEGIALFLAPVEAPESYKKISFWDDVYGVDFSIAKDVFSKKLMVETVDSSQFLAEPRLFAALDLRAEKDPGGGNVLHFAFDRPGTIHGFAGWFTLELCDGVTLSTAPGQPITHWKQAFFCVTEPITVIEKDILELTMSIEAESDASDNSLVRYDYRCTQRVRCEGADLS